MIHTGIKNERIDTKSPTTIKEQGETSSVWVGERDEPTGKGLVLYKHFLNNWTQKQNQENIVTSMPS